MNLNDRKQFAEQLIQRRVESAYPSREAVVERIASGERLTIYLGIDPTSPDIHLGHTVPLFVMRGLAELGHDVVLLIGDFTARIGDPTGKSSTRVALTTEQIQENMAAYVEQVEHIIPKELFRVAYNSEWLASLTMEQVLRLTSTVTVQQMIQRDMFQERLKEEKPIFLSEFLYPLMQGYDSVALRTDGEVGGNDQTFNMLMGRELSRELLGKDKLVITTKLLVDAGSGKKMSKSEGTLIAIRDSAQEIRRKVLAADDGMIVPMFELCTEKEVPSEGSPREMKEALAVEFIRMFHGEQAVKMAGEYEEFNGENLPFDSFMSTVVSGSSLSTIARQIEQGGVKLNEQVLTLSERKKILQSGDKIQFGKGRFIRVR